MMESGRIGAAVRGSQGVINPPTPDGRPRLGTGGVFTGLRNVHYSWLVDARRSTNSLNVMPLDYNSILTCHCSSLTRRVHAVQPSLTCNAMHEAGAR